MPAYGEGVAVGSGVDVVVVVAIGVVVVQPASIEIIRNVGNNLYKGFISVSTLLMLEKRVGVLLSMKIALFKEQGYP